MVPRVSTIERSYHTGGNAGDTKNFEDREIEIRSPGDEAKTRRGLSVLQ